MITKTSEATFVLVLIMLSLTSCGDKSSRIENAIANRVSEESFKDLRGYHAIFFIPSSGCSGCISGAEDFLMKYVGENAHNILFVITGHDSVKAAKVRLGTSVLEHNDVYFDFNHTYDQPPFIIQYPKLIFLENGFVSSVIDVSPENRDVYEQLTKVI